MSNITYGPIIRPRDYPSWHADPLRELDNRSAQAKRYPANPEQGNSQTSPAPSANAKQYGGTHYKDMGVEPWDVVDTWPIEQQIGYYRGGALKYVMRLGTKDEQLQEARKAGHYIEKLIEVLEHAGSQAETSPGT